MEYYSAKKKKMRPGVVAHTCNPSTLGGQGRWITWGQEFEASVSYDHAIAHTSAWATQWDPVSKKTIKEKEIVQDLSARNMAYSEGHGNGKERNSVAAMPS